MNNTKNIINAPYIKETKKIIANMYRLGWDERNGGNISYLLTQDEVSEYLDLNEVIRTIPIDFDATELVESYFLVTGTGKYFRNVEDDVENNLGIVRIGKDGKTAEIMWGFSDGGKFTSEFPAHLMSHIERLKVDKTHRIVMHTHPTNTIAMTLVHSINEREFTRTLWKCATECVVVFPDGVGVIPWMVCGTNDIGRKTADKLKEFRACIWAIHGIFGTGSSIDEAFGLIETIEKTAEIYMISSSKQQINEITDEQLKELAETFNVKIKNGYLY